MPINDCFFYDRPIIDEKNTKERNVRIRQLEDDEYPAVLVKAEEKYGCRMNFIDFVRDSRIHKENQKGFLAMQEYIKEIRNEVGEILITIVIPDWSNEGNVDFKRLILKPWCKENMVVLKVGKYDNEPVKRKRIFSFGADATSKHAMGERSIEIGGKNKSVKLSTQVKKSKTSKKNKKNETDSEVESPKKKSKKNSSSSDEE